MAKKGRKKTTENSKLNAKQRRFVQEYVIDLNGAAAARRAGYAQPDANVQACRNLARPHVRKAVQELCEKIGKSLKRDKAAILSDIIAVKEMAIAKGNDAGALKALELEGKHQAMFTDKKELSNPDGTLQPIIVLEIPSNGRD